MKSSMLTLALTTLTSLSMIASVPAVRAQTTAVNPTTLGSSPSYVDQITPFNLVNQAYRGYFKAQGIPSYETLIAAHRSGQIRATDVVQGAIQLNRLSKEILNDREYLYAVEAQLNGLELDR
jgi:hypothetical protein